MRVPAHVRRHLADTLLITAITTGDSGMTTLLPPLFRDQGKGPISIGVLVAVPAIVALLIRLPGGLLYSPSRARPLLFGALSLAAVSAGLFPHTDSVWLLVAIGTVYGAGFSAATTVNMAAMIDSLRPDEDRGRAVGFYVAGMSFGYAVGALVWGFVAQAAGFGAAFLGMAAMQVVALGVVLLSSAPEPAAAMAQARPAGTAWRRAQSFGAALMDPAVTFMVMGSFFLNIFLSQFNTFMPLTLLPLGLTLGELGALRSIWSFTNAIGRFLGGPVLSWLDHRRAQNGGLVLQAGMLALFALTLPFGAYVAITILAASGRAVCYVANAVALSEVDPAKVGRGLASGVMNAAGDLGKILGPVSGGFIASAAGLRSFWLISPPLYLAIYFAVLFAVRRKHVQGAPVAV
ncbi:MAG: MFS transporter [Chloroflexota bacterium]